jgi:hypothetical protein
VKSASFPWAVLAACCGLLGVACLATLALVLVWPDRSTAMRSGPPPAVLERGVPLKAFGVSHLFGYGHADRGRYGLQAYSAASAPLQQLLPPDLLSSLKGLGFTGTRLAVDPAPLMAAENDRALDVWIDLIEPAVRRIVDAGFRCIIDMHPSGRSMVPGFSAADLIDGPSGPTFRRLVEVETRLAARLARTFAPTQIAFELFNEPPPTAEFKGKVRWPTQLEVLYQAVRAVAPGLTLVVAGAEFGGIEGLLTLDPARFDADTIFSFHHYHPMMFTHQSVDAAYMAPYEAIHYMRGLPFPPRASDRERAVVAARAAIEADGTLAAAEKVKLKASAAKLLAKYFDTPMDEAWIGSRVAEAARWADRKRIARSRIFWGEFGAWGDFAQLKGADLSSRANYLGAARRHADALGFSWAVWELNNQYTAWGILDASGKPIPDLVAALFDRTSGLSGK